MRSGLALLSGPQERALSSQLIPRVFHAECFASLKKPVSERRAS
jgi:hypothetical protein